jgi:hypothetical protein
MRFVIIGLLAAGVFVGACRRTDMAAPPATADPAAGPTATRGTFVALRETVQPGPSWREVTIPAGTHLPIALDTTVASDTSRIEQPVQAHLVSAISVNGETVLPEGTRVRGVVTDATRSARVKGRAHIAMRFDTLTPRDSDERYAIQTASVGRTAPATKKKDAITIGAPAVGGAIVGAIAGGKKGALIGTAAGGGTGTAVVLSTRGKEVRLVQGARLTLRLTEPVTVRIRAAS